MTTHTHHWLCGQQVNGVTHGVCACERCGGWLLYDRRDEVYTCLMCGRSPDPIEPLPLVQLRLPKEAKKK